MLGGMSVMTRKADQLLAHQSGAQRERGSGRTTLNFAERSRTGSPGSAAACPFLILNGAWFVIWIAVNTLPLGIDHKDPYPFGLLTMIVSLEAIFLSCFVLISQNRQSEKDHVRSDIEYEINIKAELEVAHLHEKTDRIYEAMLERFAKLETICSR